MERPGRRYRVDVRAHWIAARRTLNLRGLQKSSFKRYRFNKLQTRTVERQFFVPRFVYTPSSEKYGWSFSLSRVRATSLPRSPAVHVMSAIAL